MVEEAVEEVLDLVKKAAQQIKPTEINPDFEFLIAEGEFFLSIDKEAVISLLSSTSLLLFTF